MAIDNVIAEGARAFILSHVEHFRAAKPFSHLVIDNFFETEFAEILSAEFPDYGSQKWYCYDNSIENKKALNNWNEFPAATYRSFAALNSPDAVNLISALTLQPMYADQGCMAGDGTSTVRVEISILTLIILCIQS
jgi:hypothetical protein